MQVTQVISKNTADSLVSHKMLKFSLMFFYYIRQLAHNSTSSDHKMKNHLSGAFDLQTTSSVPLRFWSSAEGDDKLQINMLRPGDFK